MPAHFTRPCPHLRSSRETARLVWRERVDAEARAIQWMDVPWKTRNVLARVPKPWRNR